MTSEFSDFTGITQARFTLITYRSVVRRNIAIQAAMLERARKVYPSVLQEKPTLPSSTRQALRGNSGISRARAESNIAECANERFLPPFIFVHYPLVGGKSLLKFFAQCSFAIPTVPCLGTYTVPCLETFVSALPGHVCSPPPPPLRHLLVPAWERLSVCMPCLGCLPVPCLGTFASALPGHVFSRCLGRLLVPCLGALACFLPGNACQRAYLAWACLQSLPGMQFPAWDRLPGPCLGTFTSALPAHALQSLPGMLCLRTFATALPGHVYQALPGNACCWDAVPMLFSHAYLRLF